MLKGREEELWDKKDGMKVLFVYDEEKERKIDVKPECGRQRASVEDRKIGMSEGNRGRGNRIRKRTELMKKEKEKEREWKEDK